MLRIISGSGYSQRLTHAAPIYIDFSWYFYLHSHFIVNRSKFKSKLYFFRLLSACHNLLTSHVRRRSIKTFTQIRSFRQTTMNDQVGEVSILVTTENDHRKESFLMPVQFESRRGTSCQDEIASFTMGSRRPSMAIALRRPSVFTTQRKFIMDLFASHNGSTRSLNAPTSVLKENHMASIQKARNRKMGK